MEIVSASLLDLNALRSLEKACFPTDAWPLFDLISVLSFAGVVRLKAVENGHMIGFVAGDPRPKEGFSWIATLGVLPENRKHGIGSALLAACEQQLATRIIHLSVRSDNDSAIKMYKRAGYYKIDRWPNYYNDGQDALIFEKVKL
jgi:ribosomal-protein-alanine N-acetyltransferase